MRRVIWAGLVILLVTSLSIVGACGGGPPPAAPPPPSYEAPPMGEMLAVGETHTVGGLNFTVVEYVLALEMKGEVPLMSGFQFLMVRFKAENTTGAPMAPPYLDEDIVIVHKGEPSGIPSLLFSPVAPLPDGRDANHYSYRTHFQGELDGGATSDGWEAYYVPIEFSAVDTFVRVAFSSGEEVFWNLGK